MLDFTYKEILGFITILIVIPQTYLYIKSILIGETKPHVYTKIIWFILTGIAFIIALQGDGGPGTWVIGTTCLIQLTTLLLSFKYGSKDITHFDTYLLVLAFLCIPIYLGVDDKIYALIFIIFIDFLGYIPTIRKTYYDPYSESLFVGNLSNFKYIISLFALIEYSLYTLAYPICVIIFNGTLTGVIYYMRKHKTTITS